MKQVKTAHLAGYPVQQEVLDPFALKSLPSKNQLSTWKDELTSGHNISGQVRRKYHHVTEIPCCKRH